MMLTKKWLLAIAFLAENGEFFKRRNIGRILLEGYGYRWYRVGGLDYLLRRTDVDQKDTDVD